ncbi:hypothetical protein AB6825_07175 [Serratia proteamaculans]|uniref:hypothetical protein n=1 Tax=Serratia proteamaculans TaxID=28151 RepID=UPI00217B0272|nr:hypothetical protein [Serratia proteamaculans]CAI0972809.1 Uncharacterised protein [Serratia proteamaculans]CAI1695211.1 Uncharacterised protein [Serratia proteamaculans]CAI1706116.1 Uncharacterised protein [Serratia proteamaculans]CAI1989549.1 Uncharacterised protein [Serratia proteamaculans]CAI2487389.1 Uncharacterised protein [Serratia proteamaculans]
MKIQLSLLFLGLLAGRAAAFQSRVPEPQPEQTRAAENNIENRFYGFHALDAQTVNVGTCAALPQAGCQCAFCTMLRQAGPTK